MVFGGPGIGKSTFLRKIGLEALKGNQGSYLHNLTPVLLELKNLKLKNLKEIEIDIQAFIEKEFKICGFPNVEKSIRKKLEKGELLILLDGLDEVPSDNINDVVKEIQDFVDLYDKNRFVISCRTALQNKFNRFTNIEIVEFDDQQIKSFINNWFSFELKENNRTGQNCWELLQKEEYQCAKELCQTPLLLTFLCVIYQKKQSFPTDRSILYQEALEILLEEWAEHNGLQKNRSIDKKLNINLSVKIEKLLLSKIAYDNFLEDKLFFRKEDIVNQIEYNLQETLNFSQNPDGNKVLKTIEIEQGILVERARSEYSFSHLTFQEYLTAQYIYDNDLIEEVVKNHVTEKRWKEVFLLSAGLMRGETDKLLLAMEKEAHNYLKTSLGKSKLVPILQWADEMTKDSVDSPIKPVGRRAISYSIAILVNITNNQNIHYVPNSNPTSINERQSISYGITFVTNIDEFISIFDNTINVDFLVSFAYPIGSGSHLFNLEITTFLILISQLYENFLELAKDLSKNRIFLTIDLEKLVECLAAIRRDRYSDSLDQLEAQGLITALLETLQNTFFKNSKLPNLLIEEIEEIDKHYFYINRLILDCQKIADYLSPSVWQEIEDRMLRVP